ncbi:endo-1,4-beta-xylanase [Flavobacterium rhizosphaerae]|uniref:Beta-xylanase n=1 Tax=Flavobacterium rhizosphaerae TaxID=3163298 RepID=A0ABW8YTH4_9FLAO
MKSITIKSIAAFFLLACSGFTNPVSEPAPVKDISFKDAFKGKFYIGVAINRFQAMGRVEDEAKLIKEQFSSISPENDLKWQMIHPQSDQYNFEPADAYVNFGKESDMFIIGHTLVWHSQTPKWVFEDENGNPLTREALLKRMEDHIKTVVGRYKGVIKGWDVVNEALNEDGTLRDSKWRKIIGDDYIEKAFEFAHAADPNAELYYNDYNMYKAEKRAGAVKLVEKLKAKGLRITAVGAQAHYSLENGTLQEVEATIKDFINAGVHVNFTELDISVLPNGNAANSADVANSAEYKEELNPYTKGLPAEVQTKLADKYGNLFKLFVKYKKHIDRVTFWGLSDRTTWLNNFPIRGRTNYPLPFNRDLSVKKDVKEAILSAVQTSR